MKLNEMPEYKIVPRFFAKKYLPDELFQLLPNCPLDVVADLCPEYPITKGDLVKSLELDFAYDYSLPQGEVDKWRGELGVDIVLHFIWSAKTQDLYPITTQGRVLWKIIQCRRQSI